MYLLLLKNKNIRYYLLGGCISRLGDVLAGMAFLFLAYDMTSSTIHTTSMAIASTAPYLLFGLIGGVIADWLPRKKLLIMLDLARIPLVLSVFLLDQFGILTFAYLLIVSFVIQTMGCFFNPAHRAILPIITKPEQRSVANGLNDTLSRGVTVLSPILSIWLLSYGAIYFFIIDALTYTISVICLIQVHFTEQKQIITKSIKGILLAIADFCVWVKEKTTIKDLFLITFIIVFFNTWVWQVGLLLALNELTANSEEIYSILQGVFGGTVILTNLMLPYFFKKMNLKIYLIGAAIWGVGITYYGLLYQVEHFFIGAVLVGIGLPISSLARVYLIQALVPSEMLGRAFSSNAFLLYLANTISLVVYGALVYLLPIRHLMIGSGFLIMAVSLIGLAVFTIKQAKLSRRSPVNFFK
ncbi:MFS transporter [Virgibacillus sp. C22-A2]|uniref:MFS transporter n=1 Tax=Virgibacillus tibetensis TaxID=3042313 RepID=A0ABU6KLE9_9BACI|nr:MFS transporter [Virgibacillus sp. C22-A2]